MVDGHFESKHFLTSELSYCDGMFGIIHDVEWKHKRVNICLPLKIQLATGRNNLHSANVMVTVKVNIF